jgi:predicted PurR-regulated permease PerM
VAQHASSSLKLQRTLALLTGSILAVIVVLGLYWAQIIFIPIAAAVFLSFVLTPIVTWLQRRRLGRGAAVGAVVLLTALAIGGVGWVVADQVSGLVHDLPNYSKNIKDKVRRVRSWVEGPGSINELVKEVTQDPKKAGDAVEDRPAAVAVEPEGVWVSRLPATLRAAVEPLGGVALTLVLVVFMLVKREDLRNRLIRLIGYSRMTVTTKAVDDASHRISRFLLTQLILNSAFGAVFTLGLSLIGVPQAFLWGVLITVLRYVPYVGSWFGLLMPLTLSLAMFEDWTRPLLVVGLFGVLELSFANFLEPLFFGHSIGVSEVALLVAAAFWGWLWGPIGLVLAAPLTVCLAVLGKYVPQLEFLDVLLGDAPPLETDVSFYQRLLAADQDEAAQIVEATLKDQAPETVYDQLLIPALAYTKRDRGREALTESDEQAILNTVREIVEDLATHSAESKVLSAESGIPLGTRHSALGTERSTPHSEAAPVLVLGCPARDAEDEMALHLFSRLLDARWLMEVLTEHVLTSELMDVVEAKRPAALCVASLPPGGLAHARYLCKRLRARFPDLKLVVGLWGAGTVNEAADALREAGADYVTTSLLDARAHLNEWQPVFAAADASVLSEKG